MSARQYICTPVHLSDALAELERARLDARIVNLETAVTTVGDAWPGKGVHYRMHPENVSCLTGARIDCCTLANNHVVDWGYGGLADTLAALHRAGMRTDGAALMWPKQPLRPLSNYPAVAARSCSLGL